MQWSLSLRRHRCVLILGLLWFIGTPGFVHAQFVRYPGVRIGDQVWMAENLNVDRFRNGDPIPEARTDAEWEHAAQNGWPAWCHYANDSANGATYGKLYNWHAVNDPRGLAPEGWHVPTDAEWTRLTNRLGGVQQAVRKLKSRTGWADAADGRSGNGSNLSGFSGRPGGFRSVNDGGFRGMGVCGIWWNATIGYRESYGEVMAGPRMRSLWSRGRPVDREVELMKGTGYSVRCLMDPPLRKKRDAGSHPVHADPRVVDSVPVSHSPVPLPSVVIGDQVWMAENLNLDRFRNGDPIAEARTSIEWQRATENRQPAWCYFYDDNANERRYGRLYNGYAVQDPRGLAPEGWHVPTDAEWEELVITLGGEKKAVSQLKDTQGWKYDKSKRVTGTNSSGFSGRPAGYRHMQGAFSHPGEDAVWWSITEVIPGVAVQRSMHQGDEAISRNGMAMGSGFSIRCLRDRMPDPKSDSAPPASKPANPSAVQTRVSPYPMVKIGGQLWMAENLNVDRFRNGDPIPEARTDAEWKKAHERKQPAWCYGYSDSANGATSGKLYNWYAVSDPRRLAPEGWHVASDDEWTRLTDRLGGEQLAGLKLKSDQGWSDRHGHVPNGSNSSGFTALNGGQRWDHGAFIDEWLEGNGGYWWTSTPAAAGKAWYREMSTTHSNRIKRVEDSHGRGFSVRCVRD
jgi:uncharacterized protein (TIGR02145 family)